MSTWNDPPWGKPGEPILQRRALPEPDLWGPAPVADDDGHGCRVWDCMDCQIPAGGKCCVHCDGWTGPPERCPTCGQVAAQ